jgi:hypothetical protein
MRSTFGRNTRKDAYRIPKPPLSPKPRDELAVAIFKMENNAVPCNNHLPQIGHNHF